MKNVAAIFLLLLLLPIVALPGAEERIQNSGRKYRRLDDWAESRNYTVRWTEREKAVQLTDRSARIAFTVNSRQAEINGVQVWLSFPLLYRDGAAYIAQLDLDETLAPVLSPTVSSSSKKIKTICLDPGHGGTDPGYRVGQNEEQEYTLLLAQEVRSQLQKAGFKVTLTRTKDTYVDLPVRSRTAIRQKADLFVSLHFNSFPSDRSVNGVETYCVTPAGAKSTNAGGEGDTRWVQGNRYDNSSMLLAYQVHNCLLKELSAEDRGVRRARFKVLCEAGMPAILVEGGFMSHPAEGKKIFDAGYRRQLARAIVEGIIGYKRITKG